MPGGYLAFVCPKNIIKALIRDGNQIDYINLMEKDVWDYNTLYFIERNIKKETLWNIGEGICSKMFGVSEWKYNEFNRTENRKGTGSLKAVIQLPKRSNDYTIETEYVKTALQAAPRFAFTLLESKKSYTVTDLPYCASMSGCITLDTLSEAENLKRFVENNKGLRYFSKKMKLKGLAKDSLRFMKKFDLSKINTGAEYPEEWNLTAEEIKIIEDYE